MKEAVVAILTRGLGVVFRDQKSDNFLKSWRVPLFSVVGTERKEEGEDSKR